MQTHSRPVGPQNRGNGAFRAGANVGTEAEEKWHVQVAAGDVRLVTLDKLDDLFRYDVIDENAFVWQPGMPEWKPLYALLGQSAPDANEPKANEQEDPFHVCFAPNDVRVLTLEQLDDFYRIGVIEEATLVWQNGMAEWQTLGKLAGISAAPGPLSQPPATQRYAERVTQPYAANQLQSIQPYTVPPPRSVTANQQSGQRAYGAPSVRPPTVNQPAPQQPHAAPSVRPPTVSLQAPQPVPSLGPSSPPITLDIEPEIKQHSSAASWLMRTALAAGVLLALVRNDMIHQWVQHTQLAPRYAEAETKVIGGPAFGTTRAVEQLVAECGGHLEPVRLPIAVTQYVDSQKRHSPAPTDATGSPGVSNGSATSASAAAGTAAPNVPKSSTENPAPSANAQTEHAMPSNSKSAEQQLSREFGKALGGPARPAPRVRTKPVAAPQADSPRPAGTKTGLKGSGSYFDPLNGAL